MIALLALIFLLSGISLFLHGSFWGLACLVVSGCLWVVSDSFDDDLTALGGIVILFFFGVASYVIIKQVAIWLTDLMLIAFSL